MHKNDDHKYFCTTKQHLISCINRHSEKECLDQYERNSDSPAVSVSIHKNLTGLSSKY